MLKLFAFVLLVLFVILLFVEAWLLRRAKRSLTHIIHVNGTRGKSTVVRLIDAGLRAGGMRVVSKVTGTVPTVLTIDGDACPIRRRGRPNIREQVRTLLYAYREKADVLVVECMALDKKLQFVSQHRMLEADIGVITNVRADHLDVMGPSLVDVCRALSHTIPERGILFTAETGFYAELKKTADSLMTEIRHIKDVPEEKDYESVSLDIYPANVELAVAVCAHLGVPRAVALHGMKNYKRDPFAAALYRLPSGTLFINALSANDPESSRVIWQRVKEAHCNDNPHLVVIINSRRDRPERTFEMMSLAASLKPSSVWLLGATVNLMLKKHQIPYTVYKDVRELPLETLGEHSIVLAIGNVAVHGNLLIEHIQHLGASFVQ